MTATLTKWYEEHGRHEIFAGGKAVPLNSTAHSLKLNEAAVRQGAQTDLDDLGIPVGAIYIGRPGSMDEKVIDLVDPIDGSTFQDGFLWEEAINSTGQIAFWAHLADGRQGVYLAEPHVEKVTPTLDWPTPADIVYGTALGPAQLNATPSVLASFCRKTG